MNVRHQNNQPTTRYLGAEASQATRMRDRLERSRSFALSSLDNRDSVSVGRMLKGSFRYRTSTHAGQRTFAKTISLLARTQRSLRSLELKLKDGELLRQPGAGNYDLGPLTQLQKLSICTVRAPHPRNPLGLTAPFCLMLALQQLSTSLEEIKVRVIAGPVDLSQFREVLKTLC
jgi:hypothetical protein